MVVTRCAYIGDTEAVADLLLQAKGELSIEPEIAADRQTLVRSLQRFAMDPSVFFYVCEQDEEVVAAAAGAVAPLWWAKESVASDIFFYAKPGFRGKAVGLIKSFVRWAEGFDAVQQVILSNSVGNERVSRLYERLGFIERRGYFVKLRGQSE